MKKIVWNKDKNELNIKKHEVSFEDASSVFFDSLCLTVSDPDHSWYEYRFVTIGMMENNKLLVGFHTENETEIRIISARKPTKTERENYEEY